MPYQTLLGYTVGDKVKWKGGIGYIWEIEDNQIFVTVKRASVFDDYIKLNENDLEAANA